MRNSFADRRRSTKTHKMLASNAEQHRRSSPRNTRETTKATIKRNNIQAKHHLRTDISELQKFSKFKRYLLIHMRKSCLAGKATLNFAGWLPLASHRPAAWLASWLAAGVLAERLASQPAAAGRPPPALPPARLAGATWPPAPQPTIRPQHGTASRKL